MHRLLFFSLTLLVFFPSLADARGGHGSRALNFSNTQIRGQDFSGRDLSGSTLSNVEIYDCDFDDVDFSGSTFSNVKIYDIDMRGALFTGSTLSNVKIHDSELAGSKFERSTLSNVKFYGGNMRHTSYRGSTLSNVDFKNGVHLEGVDFSSASLSNVDYDEADMHGAGGPLRKGGRHYENHVVTKKVYGNARKGGSVNISIVFDKGSDRFSKGAMEQLKQLSVLLEASEYNGVSFRIEGYTDHTGPDAYYDDLAYRRGVAIRDSLVSDFGVSGERLHVRERGYRGNSDDMYARAVGQLISLIAE